MKPDADIIMKFQRKQGEAMGEIIVCGNQVDSELVREYVAVRYRMRKKTVKYDPYDLEKPRVRLMHMNDLAEFQMDLRRGGHQVLGTTRLTKAEFEKKKAQIKARKEARKQIS